MNQNDDNLDIFSGKIFQTSGNKKFKNFVFDLIRDERFLKKVYKLRKKYNLPKEGIARSETKTKTGVHYTYPDMYKEIIPLMHYDIEEFCMEYCLDYNWHDFFETFVIFNSTESETWGFICDIYDVKDEKMDPFDKRTVTIIDNAFPVAIRISPYASQNDITDFVKKLYKSHIKPIQDSYKIKNIKIGRVRTKKKSIQNRNDFIVKNSKLPKKEIVKLVAEKFGEVLDYAHVSKIIYLSKRN